jgi:hypothetical protein
LTTFWPFSKHPKNTTFLTIFHIIENHTFLHHQHHQQQLFSSKNVKKSVTVFFNTFFQFFKTFFHFFQNIIDYYWKLPPRGATFSDRYHFEQGFWSAPYRKVKQWPQITLYLVRAPKS